MKARLGTMRLRKSGARRGTLVNVRAKLGNVRPQRSFSESDETSHLQLHLPGLCNSQVGNNKETEHQQLRHSRYKDNRFGKCIERKCIKQERALARPGGAREHSGMIRLEKVTIVIAVIGRG